MARLFPLVCLLGIVLLSIGGQLGTALPSSIGDAIDLPLSEHAEIESSGSSSSESDSSSSSSSDSDSSSSSSSDSDDDDVDTDFVLLVEDSSYEDDLDFGDDGEPVDEGANMPVEEMSNKDMTMYLDLEEQIFVAEADEHIGRKIIQERISIRSSGQNMRRKRVAPLIGRAAWMIGRNMFRRFARTGVTRSGRRLTRHYAGRGNYRDALRDFNRMRPDNVRNFNGRISGRTGTIGRHRVTVRDGSSARSGNRPTLEIRSHGGELVRKMRYD